MTYYDECRLHAEKGLNELKDYLNSERNLTYTEEIEENCGENGEDITCIEVEVLDEDMCVDFLDSYEFDEFGKLIKNY